MRKMMLLLLAAQLLIVGCLDEGSPSGACPYGNYGESCSTICEKLKGTEFYEESCFSDCTDLVAQAGAGDASTCCEQTIRQGCADICEGELQSMMDQYGPEVVGEDVDTFVGECSDECTGAYEQVGIDIDSTCMIPIDY